MTDKEKIKELLDFLSYIQKTTEDDYIAWQIKELKQKYPEEYGN